MMCVWAVLSACPPSPRAAAASPLNAREPEPEPEPRLALRQPQHPGPPQSPHVTSDCPITAAPAHIKGAGRPRATPPGCPGDSRSAREGRGLRPGMRPKEAVPASVVLNLAIGLWIC
nr:uncharacterized protein LOC111775661 [Equus caballus]